MAPQSEPHALLVISSMLAPQNSARSPTSAGAGSQISHSGLLLGGTSDRPVTFAMTVSVQVAGQGALTSGAVAHVLPTSDAP